jgi:hypothetical protein
MKYFNKFGLSVGLGLLTVSPWATRAQPAATGEVHGSIVALIRQQEGFSRANAFVNTDIFLPDINVYLTNTKNGATTTSVNTDLDGSFAIPAQPPGQYQLCWKSPGFAPGCGVTFVLRTTNVYLEPVGVDAMPGAVYGRAALKDGTPCRFLNPMMGKDIWTTVTAEIPGGTRLVRANSHGQYVIPQVPAGSLKLGATCEGAKVGTTVTVTSAAQNVDLTLPNVVPQVQSVVAGDGTRMVRASAGGSVLQVHATARDGGGYPLHYQWAVDPTTPGFVSVDAPDIAWTLPNSGRATIYVLASDGMGGNAFSRASVSTTPNSIPFSGIVTANDAPAVPGAQVTINGIVAQTNASGAFSMVLPGEAPRYVVTIRKSGYQMLSRALYAPVVGATFRLNRAQDFVVDPTGTIKVTELRGKDAKGVSLMIPANSLAQGLDGRGKLASDKLHLRVASYDLRDATGQLPGDYGGIDKQGAAARLETFGSADIAVEDSTGQPYNLAPGKEALISVPVDQTMLSAAPLGIPVWHYDVTRGLWTEDGAATLAGNAYQTKVTHFSAVNMDLAFQTAACTIILVDTGVMPVPFKLLMTPQSGAAVAANHQEQTIGDAINIVVREPPNIDVKFDATDMQGNLIASASQTINTGAATPQAIEWQPAPNPPYTDASGNPICSSTLVFPTRESLQFLTFNHPNFTDAKTQIYYAAIDPNHANHSLTKTEETFIGDFDNWKTANGFGRAGVRNTTYLNQYDLGFGRDMYMQTGGQDGSCANCVAFYVTNYQNVDEAVAHQNQLATVAMEYSPQNGSTGVPYTKFYVFNADGSIADSVDLDGNGKKNVPSLCAVCHNGNQGSLTPTDGNLQNARFIPFDLQSFGYAATKSRGPQEPDFKEMNRVILQNTNPSAAMQDLIKVWYGFDPANPTNPLPNPTAADNTPDLWNTVPSDALLYHAVVEPACRSCHNTRDPGDPPGMTIAWQSYDQFNTYSTTIRPYTCVAGSHFMPNAKRTFARFWLSTNPNAPDALAASGLSAFQSPQNTCQ